MSELHLIEFTLKERNLLVGTLDNKSQSLGQNGHLTEADEYNSILRELWEHTSIRSINLPEDTPVTISLTLDHWFLLASILDVSAFQFQHRYPEESECDLRLRDHISETLGENYPEPLQPSAPKYRDVRVQVDELGCYWLFDASSVERPNSLRVLGKQLEYDAWIEEGNGLAVRSLILTGTRDGVIDLTAELLQGSPPLETDSWDDIAEYSWSFLTTDAPEADPPLGRTLRAAAPGRDAVTLFRLDPVWPSTCMYRIRASVRGRDAGAREQHLIQVWRAPSEPGKLIKATDMTGRRRRIGRP
jgi:hypothetical protein